MTSFRKNTELPKETYTFIGKREVWKTEIEEVMDKLKKSENELVKREVFFFFFLLLLSVISKINTNTSLFHLGCAKEKRRGVAEAGT